MQTLIRPLILRDNREQQLSARLGEFRPEADTSDGGSGDGTGNDNTRKLGLSIEPLTPDAKSQSGLPATTQGVLVREVDPLHE